MIFGKGLNVESADGDLSLNFRLRFQGRFTQENETGGDSSQNSSEFQIRRARLSFRGHLLDKNYQYYVQLGFSDQDMEKNRPVPLRDAVFTYSKYRNLKIAFGQMKVPFNRERVISDGIQQFVDRTISNNELNVDRDVGIQFFSNDFLGWNRIGYSFGVFGGDGRNKTSSASGLFSVGKLTYYPLGTYTDSGEPDLEYSKYPKLSLSLAGGKNVNTNRSLSTFGEEFQFARFTYAHSGADFVFKWLGFSLSGEYLTRNADAPYRERETSLGIEREYSRSVSGGMLQTGYLLTRQIEFSIRYSEYRPKGNTDPNLIYSRERNFAISYYLNKHDLKLQADYAYLEGEVAKNGAHQFRAQLQVYF